MKRFLWKPAALASAFMIGIAAAQLTRTLWTRQHPPAKYLTTETNKPTEPQPQSTEDVAVEGRYSNFDYAYSVLVPKGMTALMNSTPPNPNHGFGIDLTSPRSISWLRERTTPKAILWVDASYDSAEYNSPRVVIQNSLSSLREKHRSVRLVGRTSTRLGSLRAVRFLIAYAESGALMIEDQIVAFRSQLGEGSDIVYTIELTTPASRYDRDKKCISEIKRSWLIDPLPNDYPLSPEL